MIKEYGRRNYKLRALGHDSYKDYLKSKHWKELKKKKRDTRKAKCRVCHTEKNLNLHHRTYKSIGNEHVGDVIWLCADCHNETHKLAQSGLPLCVASRNLRRSFLSSY